ncbi:hypothetical protein GCM10020366_26690 [Saccharopolyspora gregorii]|uniref:Uncharacterized protein n=1 Tax=Saccharopolyspora gregorii TaxID=33914 RepID=A0ABP6RP17_9PSEU
MTTCGSAAAPVSAPATGAPATSNNAVAAPESAAVNEYLAMSAPPDRQVSRTTEAKRAPRPDSDSGA